MLYMNNALLILNLFALIGGAANDNKGGDGKRARTRFYS
ncbi:hypothetical protein Hena1_01880 [Erwinia phage Hena1]|uniref:Uncharacterized protein n=1 Tax=Erwinia phage Hena1 TaxID=2678601 RepID=A0A6B9J6C1_9CAUD|nr:hypothetical protein HWC84_gp176 [Erwinia phage Hena1]QGZ16338.1 hypothetical protein Hena1_01880 [Erwinia phage Hena1]